VRRRETGCERIGPVDAVEKLAVVVAELHVAAAPELFTGIDERRNHFLLFAGDVKLAKKTRGLQVSERFYGSIDGHFGGAAVPVELAEGGLRFRLEERFILILLDHVSDDGSNFGETGGAVEELLERFAFQCALGFALGAHFGFEFAKLRFFLRREDQNA